MNNQYEGQVQEPVESCCLQQQDYCSSRDFLSTSFMLPEGTGWSQLGSGVPLTPAQINQILGLEGEQCKEQCWQREQQGGEQPHMV